MATATVGVAASLVVHAAGVYLFHRERAAALRMLPREWLEHDVVGPMYRAERPLSRAELVAWRARRARYLLFCCAVFVALDALDVAFRAQLVACALFAAINTGQAIEGWRDRTAALMREHELPPVPRSRRVSVGHFGATFLASLGLFATGCFAARLAFALAA